MYRMDIMMFIVGIFLCIQISIWQIVPKSYRDILFSNPILAFIVNLIGSCLIVGFTGVASVVGICNLAASVLFGIYALVYKKCRGIVGTEIKWKKIGGFLPLKPTIKVIIDEDQAWARR